MLPASPNHEIYMHRLKSGLFCNFKIEKGESLMSLKKSSCQQKRRPAAAAGLLSLLLTILLLAPGSLSRSSAAPHAANSAAAPTLRQKAKIQDKGDFKVVYYKVKNKEYAQWQKELQEEKVLEEIVADLNQTFALPADIYVNFSECGEVNAFYDPETRKLSMCYELLENYYEIFAKHEKSEEALDDAVVGAIIHTFYHELGHALIHVYDLPIAGKEEDAVDQLSTFLLTDGTPEGEKAALDGARTFYLEAKQQDTEIDELAYWDEHSLNMQRFYNIICMVYGQNEKKYSYLVKKGILPEARAERCAGEYEQVEKAWTRLLAPYIKN
jgi:hypothetical protein